MKVYLVDVDNGESYEDYRHIVDAVFTTYRGASEWLMKQGYEPYHYINYKNEDEIVFYHRHGNHAEIEEMEVLE